jgi:hypothetical protein
MSLDPTGEVRPSFQKTAPQQTQRSMFEPRSRLPSLRKAILHRHGLLDDLIERIFDPYLAPNEDVG